MNHLKIKLLQTNAQAPFRASDYAAGYDLFACLEEDVVIGKGETKKIGTGIALEMPKEDMVAMIYARSSMGAKYSVIPANAVGVIDYDYRGEVIVALHNGGTQDYTVSHGDRIAQLVLTHVYTPDIAIVETLNDTARGMGGFGSTGKA